MSYTGVLIGLCAFFLVGCFHPLVIKVEYHYGKRTWPAFALLGVVAAAASLVAPHFWSLLLGVLGAASGWSALEVVWQHGRAKRGEAKRNPKRPDSYYQ
ncbi:MAG: DUF4491 domain-containing protein [Bacteroidia bacterium]|nr:MAG: DUF4491 domain-containing protein [Bacteroidia bacterium]